MGLEQKINKWIIGAVMGRRYVIEHEMGEEGAGTHKKNSKDGIKGFLELGVDELKQNVGVKVSQNTFGKKEEKVGEKEVGKEEEW